MQQNNIFKTREEKYQSRINVLEALASGTGVEHEVSFVMILSDNILLMCYISSALLMNLFIARLQHNSLDR